MLRNLDDIGEAVASSVDAYNHGRCSHEELLQAVLLHSSGADIDDAAIIGGATVAIVLMLKDKSLPSGYAATTLIRDAISAVEDARSYPRKF